MMNSSVEKKTMLPLDKAPRFSHPAGSTQDPSPSPREPGRHLGLLEYFAVQHFNTGADSLQRKHEGRERDGWNGLGRSSLSKTFALETKIAFIHPQAGGHITLGLRKGWLRPQLLTAPSHGQTMQPSSRPRLPRARLHQINCGTK